jgi:hypothetical protein
MMSVTGHRDDEALPHVERESDVWLFTAAFSQRCMLSS